MASDDLEELKKHPGVLRVYGQYVRLKKEKDLYKGLCPFHAEKSGSFAVYQKDLLFHCFGCGKSGNILQFVQELDKSDFRAATDKVRSLLGENRWEQQREHVEAVFRPILDTPKTVKTYTLAEYEVFENALLRNPAALDWLLRERGIGPGTAQRLHLGYRQDVGRLAGEKNAAIAGSGWVAFPTVEGDTVTSIKYRSLAAKAFCKQPGMATALFNTEAIDLFEPLYVVEGELDAAILDQAGFRVVSLPSASTGLTPAMKDLLMQASAVILAGDNDGPGAAAMEKLWRELSERTYLLRWPDDVKDANQFFLETCNRDQAFFNAEIARLTHAARSQPMPDVYSLAEIMTADRGVSLKDRPDRLRFPWPSVDNMVILLPGNTLSLFATQTGTGKTAWQMQVTLHNAMHFGRTVLNYQCELSTGEFATIAAANILSRNRNYLQQADYQDAADTLQDTHYYIGYDPAISTVDAALDLIEAAIRRLSVDIVVIDHIHFLARNEQNEVAALANAMQRINRLGATYRCTFIVVGQPRKATQQNRGKLVHLSDAKGSETFASDAHALIALHRDAVKSDDPNNPVKDNLSPTTGVHLLKARSKGEGNAEANLLFLGEFARFNEIDYRYNDTAPDPVLTGYQAV